MGLAGMDIHTAVTGVGNTWTGQGEKQNLLIKRERPK